MCRPPYWLLQYKQTKYSRFMVNNIYHLNHGIVSHCHNLHRTFLFLSNYHLHVFLCHQISNIHIINNILVSYLPFSLYSNHTHQLGFEDYLSFTYFSLLFLRRKTPSPSINKKKIERGSLTIPYFFVILVSL